MCKYLFRLSVLSILMGCYLSGAAFAADYTAKRSKAAPENKEKKICTSNDLSKIKRFNRLAKAKVKEKEVLDEEFKYLKSKKQAEDFIKRKQRNEKFFNSGEYKDMKVIYKRCGQKIPEREIEPPFWMPPE